MESKDWQGFASTGFHFHRKGVVPRCGDDSCGRSPRLSWWPFRTSHKASSTSIGGSGGAERSGRARWASLAPLLVVLALYSAWVVVFLRVF